MLVNQARGWVRAAKHVAVLTGAGISAESGIPTFRGSGGLWRNFRSEDLATPDAFSRDPVLVWEWYAWRRGIIAAAQPNAGHRALVDLAARLPQFTLMTQNVDGLHERAGSQNVLLLHGSIWRTRCLKCGAEREDHRVPLPELPPVCDCGGVLRPGIVWFGETLPREVWKAAVDAVSRCDLLIVVGTSAVVYPAVSLIPLAREAGAKVVEINPEATPVSASADCSLRGPSGQFLPLLVA